MLTTNCKTCQGRGYVISDSWGGVRINCPTCNGSGGFVIPKDKLLCPQCNGSGRCFDEKFHKNMPCKICKGNLFIDKK